MAKDPRLQIKVAWIKAVATIGIWASVGVASYFGSKTDSMATVVLFACIAGCFATGTVWESKILEE